MAVRKWTSKREWLILGIVAGNLLPDLDALALGYATFAGKDTHGLHRTFSHSIVVILGLVAVFYLISAVSKRSRIGYLGLGLGIGMLMHALLDLVIWFRGVEIFWPFYGEINFWSGITTPAWWYNTFEVAVEFLLLALFFMFLANLARKQGTDSGFLKRLKGWTWVQFVLFLIFIVLVYTWDGYYLFWGIAYTLSLILALSVIVKMRKTIEGIGISAP
jgi:membrane-bound metal-dependent hydrolase YbcI (DUF457 family)